MEEKISKPVIKLVKNGPLKISGSYVLSDENNEDLGKGKEVYLCCCGKSKKSPYCDGSHRAPLQEKEGKKESCE